MYPVLSLDTELNGRARAIQAPQCGYLHLSDLGILGSYLLRTKSGSQGIMNWYLADRTVVVAGLSSLGTQGEAVKLLVIFICFFCHWRFAVSG